jgi:hypothetical protein
MEIRAFKPHFTVIGLLVLASLALGFSVDVHIEDVAGVKVELPDVVGDWTGEEIRFCQNGSCQATWTLHELGADRDHCPKCGGQLDSMASVEKALLPPDTILLKKQYANRDGRRIYASIVLSGKERASIHRPEVCLVGQGSEITRRKVTPVDIAGRGPLRVMMMDLLYRRHESGGRLTESASYYAYWFVGNGRETPHHWQRMLWMATDRILYSRAHRWAYIAVTGTRKIGSEDYRKEAAGFIHDLYPEMSIARAAGS